jgi:hypothetical protein
LEFGLGRGELAAVEIVCTEILVTNCEEVLLVAALRRHYGIQKILLRLTESALPHMRQSNHVLCSAEQARLVQTDGAVEQLLAELLHMWISVPGYDPSVGWPDVPAGL